MAVSGLSAAVSNLLGSNTSVSVPSGKVELPIEEDEPLTAKGLVSEKCELRIEGMTCSACVEVRASQSRCAQQILNTFAVYRGHAQDATRYPFYQSRVAG